MKTGKMFSTSVEEEECSLEYSEPIEPGEFEPMRKRGWKGKTGHLYSESLATNPGDDQIQMRGIHGTHSERNMSMI